ncbi:MAG: hypothetical protein CL816_02960 [Coxiellaceae bacterium]|nr:hypothetical protein [Coxiellaceae bacterium]|tara:strand:+ start:5459 stop:6790 length:1332 start_codon:yes stop_codon:yes gene_type:complete
MSVLEVTTAWDAEQLQALLARENNPVLLDFREQQVLALEAFLAQGFPTRRNEAWKYSPLSHLSQQQLNLPDTNGHSIADFEQVLSFKAAGVASLVFIDGCLSSEHSDLEYLEQYMEVRFNHEVSSSNVDDFFNKAQLTTDPLVQLNAGLLTHHMTLCVKPRVIVERPMQLLHYFSGASMHTMHHTALRIELGESASLSLLQEGISEAGVTVFHNQVTDIVLAANAKLNHYELQRYADTVTYVTQTRMDQQRDSEWMHCAAQLGAGLSRNALTTDLRDNAASCSLIGFSHVTGCQHIDTHVLVNHQASHTVSQQFFRNLVDDRGVSVFSGKAQVDAAIASVTADQTNNNLLLSPGAKAYIRPQLEIDADDVKCSHGATVGQLDPRAVFYCRSRGMSESLARALLLHSYVDALLENVPTGVCLDRVRYAMMEKVSRYATLTGATL